MENNNVCGICGRTQEKIGEFKGSIMGKQMTFPQYNISLLTYMCGNHICEDCMITYRKIHAMMSGIDFSCNGVEYYADGRNLKR